MLNPAFSKKWTSQHHLNPLRPSGFHFLVPLLVPLFRKLNFILMPSNAFFRFPTGTEKIEFFASEKSGTESGTEQIKVSINPSRIPSKHTLFFLNIRPDYTLFLSRAQKVVRKSGKSSKKTMKSSKKILILLNEHPANSARKLALHSVSE